MTKNDKNINFTFVVLQSTVILPAHFPTAFDISVSGVQITVNADVGEISHLAGTS